MTAESRGPQEVTADLCPLVVDLDDCLIRTDMLLESFWAGLGRNAWGTFQVALTQWPKRQKLKAGLAIAGPVDPANLPYCPEVLSLVRNARAAGRQVVLASGSAGSVVQRIADYLGLFDAVIASDAEINLTGPRKAGVLVARFGKGGFDYVGDNRKDFPVWQAARMAYVARPAPDMLAAMRRQGLDPLPLGARWRFRDLILGLRAQQWIKNVLLFLPLIAAHRLDVAGLLAVVLGVVSFSAAASAIYVVNDLMDLEADRLHESKKHRAFAAGRVPIRIGMAASLLLGIFALVLAAAMGPGMLAVIGVYIAATLSYSLGLKRLRWVDVTMLAGLYAIRVLAGAIAASVTASGWLIGFTLPVFLALACVKRLTELARAEGDGVLPGRAYAGRDRRDLLNVAVMASIAAVLVFLAYGFSAPADVLYEQAWALHLSAVPIAFWLFRMVLTGWRGTQHHDPIVFALRDAWGIGLLVVTLAGLALAAGLPG